MGPCRRIGKVLCAMVALLALAPAAARPGAGVWTSAGPILSFDPERVDALAVGPARLTDLEYTLTVTEEATGR